MTQASRPQADHILNYPLPSDPGPYSADQWAEYMQISYTGDQQLLQGPLARYMNELEVADTAGGTPITVDIGAGYVNGHLLISDEQESFVIPNGPGGAGRTDRVVMFENNTNAAISAPTAGPSNTFLFPTDMSEYETVPVDAVPPYSARLVIVRGDDLNNLPGIDQVPAQYMVELARYNITVAVISGLEDRRSWAATPMAGMHRLRENILPAGETTVTWDNIPAAWHSLKIVVQARSNEGVTSSLLQMRFNNDAGNNYYGTLWDFDCASASSASCGLSTQFNRMARITAAGGTANHASPVEILIPNYKGAVFYKTFRASNAAYEDGVAGRVRLFESAGWWRNTAAITRIDLYIGGAVQFTAGSTFSLYGLG